MRLIAILCALIICTPLQAQSLQFGSEGVRFVFPGVDDYPYYESRSARRQRAKRERRLRARRDRERTQRRYYGRPKKKRVHVPDPLVVTTRTSLSPGTVYISTKQRKLWYATSKNEAIQYPIAVGKAGFDWKGVEKVTSIRDWPDWRPPADMRRRDRRLPVLVKGGPRNPLGATAIYLGDTLYRIHGTNDPASIGTATSSGCIRMHNDHVRHLKKRIGIGTMVVVR